MNQLNCDYVLETWPDVLHGHASAQTAVTVRAHLASCAECRATSALIAQLHAVPAEVPDGLYERVTAGRAGPAASSWSALRYYAVAATVAAALVGGSLLYRNAATGTAKAPAELGFVTVEEALVSGTASLNDLTIEELEQLLGEIES